ncbi:MAG: hypothetical protein PHV39_04005 [Methanomicrobium sp.]|nr:hypothetical protein [Methanomicrobium sp.]
MPRENIIAGGLEGDGIFGHKKKSKETDSVYDIQKSPDNASRREETDDALNVDFKSSKPEKKVSSKSASDEMTDIFATDFGSVRSSKGYKSDSSIGSNSDIFSNGFGSKDAGWMSGRKGKSPEKRLDSPYEERKASLSDKKENVDIFETSIAKNPLEADGNTLNMPERHEKKTSKDNENPFYTGFGYTDQRDNITSSQRQQSGTQLPPQPPVKKKEEQKTNKIEDEDDLFS